MRGCLRTDSPRHTIRVPPLLPRPPPPRCGRVLVRSSPREPPAMLRSFFREARWAEWAAGVSIPVWCAGVVLAQQPPVVERPLPPPPVAVTSKAEDAPNPKSAAATALDKKIIAEIAAKSEIMKNLEYISDVI